MATPPPAAAPVGHTPATGVTLHEVSSDASPVSGRHSIERRVVSSMRTYCAIEGLPAAARR